MYIHCRQLWPATKFTVHVRKCTTHRPIKWHFPHMTITISLRPIEWHFPHITINRVRGWLSLFQSYRLPCFIHFLLSTVRWRWIFLPAMANQNFCFRISNKSYFTPYPFQWGSSYFLIVWFCFFLFCQMTHSVRIFQSLDRSMTLKYSQRSFMDLSSKSMLGNVLYWCLNSEELMLRQITLTCVSITVKGKLIFILTVVSIFCPLYKNSSWQRESW